MGTGAGLPGIALAIIGYTNITMVDSKTKKISFVEHALSKLNLQAKTVNERLENINLPHNFSCVYKITFQFQYFQFSFP